MHVHEFDDHSFGRKAHIGNDQKDKAKNKLCPGGTIIHHLHLWIGRKHCDFGYKAAVVHFQKPFDNVRNFFAP
jgi:hypothetical protein